MWHASGPPAFEATAQLHFSSLYAILPVKPSSAAESSVLSPAHTALWGSLTSAHISAQGATKLQTPFLFPSLQLSIRREIWLSHLPSPSHIPGFVGAGKAWRQSFVCVAQWVWGLKKRRESWKRQVLRNFGPFSAFVTEHKRRIKPQIRSAAVSCKDEAYSNTAHRLGSDTLVALTGYFRVNMAARGAFLAGRAQRSVKTLIEVKINQATF